MPRHSRCPRPSMLLSLLLSAVVSAGSVPVAADEPPELSEWTIRTEAGTLLVTGRQTAV
ncbi:MAG: hypothetical protein RL215_2507, partial [Planctomycetota bacterium]